MGMKLNTRTADVVRQRIQCDKLIELLQDNARGYDRHGNPVKELAEGRIKSAKILLDKSLSNAPTDMNVAGDMTIKWPLPKSRLDE